MIKSILCASILLSWPLALVVIAVVGVIGLTFAGLIFLAHCAWQRRKLRRAVKEMHEHIAADERVIAKTYYPPAYGGRGVEEWGA